MIPEHKAAIETLKSALSQIDARLAATRTRARAELVRERHEIMRRLHLNYAYASQAGQDVVVDKILKQKRGGVFVDVGAYDGIMGSNSLFFEQHRAWSGVLVEPMPTFFDMATSARKSPCLNCAVGPQTGTAEFIAVSQGYTQMSGLLDHYDPKLLERVRQDPRHEESVITVQMQTLSDIIAATGTDHPDFVSLDIEGGELAVLESFPFDRHRVAIWAIENNSGSSDIRKIMTSNGYNLVEFCGPDEIYHKPN